MINGLITIISKPVSVIDKGFYTLQNKNIQMQLKKSTEDTALKIAKKAIIRYVVKYNVEEGKTIVIASWVDSEYGLSSFDRCGDIGIFKTRAEKEIYTKYILENQDLQLKVIEQLKQTDGLIVEDVPITDFSPSDYSDFVKAVNVKMKP